MSSYEGDIFIKHNTGKCIEERLSLEYVNFIKNSKYEKLINIHDVITAHGLNNYFINQKRILAGFPKENEILTEPKKVKVVTRPHDSIERKILPCPGSNVFLTYVSRKHICNKIEFEKSCKNLQAKNLGKLSKKKAPGSTKESVCFIKTVPDESLEFENNLVDFFIDLNDYTAAYKDGSD
jgi:hypothetical protein